MLSFSVFRRLKLWQTFFVLSMIALLLASIPGYLYLREANKSLDAYSAEKAGMPEVSKVLKVMQLTQQHRGLSALMLSGVADADAKRSEKQREADLAYGLVDASVAKIEHAPLKQLWSDVARDWAALRSAIGARQMSAPESFAAHGKLLANILKVNELVGDHYGLSLDPDKDSYQLIQALFYHLPPLTEETGQLRGKGASLLAKKLVGPEDRLAVSSIIARINDRVGQTTGSFDKANHSNPAIGQKLGPAMQQVAEASRKMAALAQAQIVLPEAISYDPTQYFSAATETIDLQFALVQSARLEIDRMLDAKIAAFHTTRWTMLGLMAGLLALAAWMAMMITRGVTEPLHEAISVAQAVARGKLVNDFDVGAPNEVGQMLRALKEMNDSLRAIVSEVRGSIDNIGAATRDIASGNADISARLESQASNLEQTASSMEELTSTVKQNAENARQAHALVQGASAAASQGGAVVSQVVSTMGQINDGSRKIVDIIAVIDGIAFQTNILALNAAVEAARAGEQGRGFAVVASEVRNLAQRSASAAREIKDLIGSSVEKVEAGNQLADQAGVAMGDILSSVRRITEIMADIATASAEQGAGIEQVNQAVTQMDDMTQQNAALVEQTAAASASLQDQAESLVKAMSIFELGATAPSARRSSPRPVPVSVAARQLPSHPRKRSA